MTATNVGESLIDQKEVEDSLLLFLSTYAPDVVAVWGKEPAQSYHDPISVPLAEKKFSLRAAEERSHPTLSRQKHLEFLQQMLNPASWAHEVLYMCQTWLIFWAVQAAEILDVLDTLFELVSREHLVSFLFLHIVSEPFIYLEGISDHSRYAVCGFAGSPRGKEPHLLATFAACCALCILDVQSLRNLPREGIKRWMLSIRTDEGSFRTFAHGEVDLRCSYTAAVITSLLGLDEPDTFSLEDGDIAQRRILTPMTASYVASCQTHEGGFACAPSGCEAHGSYTFCGLGALFIMGEMHRCYLPSLLRWLALRQLSFEGGFSGRTNKLVDACYSYWVGASHVLVKAELCYRKMLECCSTSTSSVGGKPHCMLAKDLAILHYVQLIDMEGCALSDEELWEKEERLHAVEEDMVDQFLSADDVSSSRVTTRMAARRAAYEKIHTRFLKRGKKTGNTNNEQEGPSPTSPEGDFFFDQRRLQRYILACCQDNEKGGLQDKPAVSADGFHTCYALAGLSLSQNQHYAELAQCSSICVKKAFEQGFLPSGTKVGNTENKKLPGITDDYKYGVVLPYSKSSNAQFSTLVSSINPVFNMKRSKVQEAWKLWGLRKTLR